MYYMSSQNPERVCQSFLNVKIWHICIIKTKLKMEMGMSKKFIIKTANQIWSTCERLEECGMNAWHVLVTDSCGCIWAPRSVTRDARVVALRVMPELSPEMRSSVLDSTCGQCHFCVSWKLALCGVTLFWQVLTSHDKYQIMRKWRGESDISKCNFNAMRQKNHIFGVVRPGGHEYFFSYRACEVYVYVWPS